MMDKLPWAVAGVFAAGIIHILAVFAIPTLAGRDAWGRLSAAIPLNTLAVADGKTVPRLPFTALDAVVAYCPFDISKGNLIVKSPLPEPAWSLSLTTRSGENFYLVTGADAKKLRVRLLVLPHERLAEEASTEEGGEQAIIVAPAKTGIVAIRAPLRGESYRAQAMEEMRKARCEAVPRIEPAVAVFEPEAAATPREEQKKQPRPQRRRRPAYPF
jgi:uncharacterized membrane protein